MKKLPFIETRVYKIYVSPLINLGFAVFGNTVGIWALYIFIRILFIKIWPNAAWPGIKSFIQDGSILLISFSFLATSLYHTTRRLKITFLNVFSAILLLGSTAFFWRAIAIKHSDNIKLQYDSLIHDVSIVIFFAAIILLYSILAREKYIENTRMEDERTSEYNRLIENFNPDQNG